MSGRRFDAAELVAASPAQSATKSEAGKVLPRMRRFQAERRHGGETSTQRKTSRTDYRDCRSARSDRAQSAGICGQTESV